MVPQFIKDIQAKKPMTPFTVDYGIEEKDDGVLRPQRDMSKVFDITKFAQQPKQDNTYDKTRFYDDVIKVKGREQISTEEAGRLVMSSYQQRGIEVVGLPYEQVLGQSTPQQNQQQEGILSSVGRGLDSFSEGMDNTVGGALSNVPRIVGNTLGFFADVVTPKQFEGLGNTLREEGIRQRGDMQRVLGVDPESFGASAGEFASELGTLFIPGGQAQLISKFPQATQRIRTLAQGLDNLGKNAPKSYNAIKTLSQSAGRGAFEMGKFGVVSEGEVTGEDLAVGAIANPVLQGIGVLGKGAINKFGGARTVEEVAGNILQPTGKYGSLNFESAKQGLNTAINKLGKKEIKDIKDYKSLLSTINKEKKSIFKPLNDRLQKIPGTFKNESADDAINGLIGVLENQPGKKFKSLLNEVKNLAKKNIDEGLSLTDMQRLKILHTQNNRLFTETGKETSGVSAEALREVRKDIKNFIEETAIRNGFRGVKKINEQYSNLLDAEGLINTQIGRLTNYLGREGKQTFLQNVAEFVTELPGVKQAITQPLQTVFGKVFKTLRAGKINPIEVEKQLPALIKELRAANVPEKAINETLKNILTTLRVIGSGEATDFIINE